MTHDATNSEITALAAIADIRAALGVGDKPMMGELPGIVRVRQRLLERAGEIMEAVEIDRDESRWLTCPCCKLSNQYPHNNDCEFAAWRTDYAKTKETEQWMTHA
ncbi:MAG: hypothetical protein ACLGSA_12725 [Acidobacteriota bacterium]